MRHVRLNRVTATVGCRHGFTVVELLVVMAVIGGLVALMLPAVQQARGAARRIQCQNKLKQIGLAVHSFESIYGTLPAGKTSERGDPKRPEMSWLLAILPQLEQSALYDSSMAAFEVNRFTYANPPHFGLGTAVQAFACPDDSRVTYPQAASSLKGGNAGLTSFVGVSGLDFRDSKGVMYLDSFTQFRDITDGTSNTLLAGERPPSPDFNVGWWYSGQGQNGTGNGDMFMGVEERVAAPGSRFSASGCPIVSRFGQGDFERDCDTLHFWSAHPGGANFLFCDGSVRFLEYSSADLLPRLATRSGGEVVE